jgi:hypothetical protein
MELEAIDHIELEIRNNSRVVFIDQHLYIFSLAILGTNVDISLTPVSVESAFYLLVLSWF